MSNFCVNKHLFDFVEESAHHQIKKSNRLTDVYNFYYLVKRWDWNLHRATLYLVKHWDWNLHRGSLYLAKHREWNLLLQ
jgi:hypothetical protein